MQLVVTWGAAVCQEAAHKLANDLHLPCYEPAQIPKDYPYFLEVTETRLQVKYRHHGKESHLFAEFVKGPIGYRIQHGGGRNQALARAVGLKAYKGKMRVIDATAGLGQDAFILASLGCSVTLIERSPIMAALLRDGLRRASTHEPFDEIVQNMQVRVNDAVTVLENLPVTEWPEVIYLDPMFPKSKKSALAKIEMRIIKEIVGEDKDADSLLPSALIRAKKRVVVKRPVEAKPLSGIAPSFLVEGKANRYDVYLTTLGSIERHE